MDQAAIFVSDLHLGRGDELDDFIKKNEDAFIRFLREKSAAFRSWEVDLVVLGDFLDIWQVATEAEKQAPDTITVGLSILNSLERQRVEQIIAAHSKTFAELRAFLAAEPAKRCLVFVIGNHDHSLVDPQVRAVVQQAVTGGNTALASRLVFADYYDAPALATYAEHGCQFDANNDYVQFSQFGAECAGFYFVRLFWNRLESLEPKLDEWDWWNIFKAIWEDSDLKHVIRPAMRYFFQYRDDPRPFERIDVPGVPFFAVPGKMPSVRRLPEFPDLLLSDRIVPDRIFSTDTATEMRLRRLYKDVSRPEFKEVVDEILGEKFSGRPPQVPDPVPAPKFGLFHDDYETAVAGMFAPSGQKPRVMPIKGSPLDPNTYKFVLLGHTHTDKEAEVGKHGARYINTGTWTVKRNAAGGNISQLCFVIVQKPTGQEVTAARYYWT